MNIRRIESGDMDWLEATLSEHFGSSRILSRGRVFDALTLPGFVAVEGDARLGLAQYDIVDDGCEVVTLTATVQGRGIGRKLIDTVCDHAREAGCRRVWLITTNDNLPAIRFYQKAGMTLAAVHVRGVDDFRHLKPEIPSTGVDGIPVRDEIEFETEL